MRVNLPADTLEFAAVLQRHAPSLKGADPATVYDGLDGLGVLDLLTDESPDPVNREINAVVALEQLARAGLYGPFAQTIWARSVSAAAREAKALLSVPSAVRIPGKVLVPYGASLTTLAVGATGSDLTLVDPQLEPADIKLQAGHAWYAATPAPMSFEDLGGSFVWRAYAAQTLGYLETALEMVLAHTKARTQFKRPLASFQAVQFRLAECRWRLSGLQLLIRDAAWRADRGDERTAAISALAWLHARQVGRIVSANVHQLYGAIGFTDELGVAFLTGASTFLRVTSGARPAVDTVWSARAPIGDSPPSNVLSGFRNG
jgi:hypothetical protein